MPKEKVLNSTTDGMVGDVEVVVGWGFDHVQIATILAGTEGSGNPKNGWYATLSEAGIDKLINDLRRARRYVYGKGKKNG